MRPDPRMTVVSLQRAALIGAVLAVAAGIGLGSAAHGQGQKTFAHDPTRGDLPAAETGVAPDLTRQDIRDGGFDRAYRQQPPLVPHKIDRYQISVTTNQCMDCHDWPNNVAQKAPKISETHYQDRSGVKIDKVAGTRWFCTQCHVSQENAKELVGNSFRNATEVAR